MPQWTLASILKSTMAFTDIPPETTIYSFRIFIQQTHTITSPRDGVVVEKSYKVPITEEGLQLGSLPRYPGPRMQALWRGKAAGGKDEEVFLAETKGRIPTDTYLRPTTFPTYVNRQSPAIQLTIVVFKHHSKSSMSLEWKSIFQPLARIQRARSFREVDRGSSKSCGSRRSFSYHL